MSYLIKRAASASFTGLTVALLVLFSAGWSQPEEFTGTVNEVGADYLVVDDMRFSITNDTRFEEGYTALSEVQVGDEVEIEYEETGGEKLALEVGEADGEEGEEEDEQEASGTVSEVGADYLIVGDTRFVVTSDTEFEEGYTRLSDVQAGDEVEVEYETRGDGTKAALEVEKGGNDDEGEDGDYEG